MAHGFEAWIGRSETAEDVVTPAPLAGLAALLDHSAPQWGDVLPPLAHWLFCLPRIRHSDLGPDGHAKRGGFLPPIELPRRMWAGGRLVFHAPLRLGASLRRVSTIKAITPKSGASGPLAFVAIEHLIYADGVLAITEDQDIVYRDGAAAAPADADADPRAPLRRAAFSPDEPALFRFSALTFNAHRIHYDAQYAREAEGYAALVVQGPFIATALMHFALADAPGAVRRFSFRARRALLVNEAAELCSDGAGRLWCRKANGPATMDAEIGF